MYRIRIETSLKDGLTSLWMADLENDMLSLGVRVILQPHTEALQTATWRKKRRYVLLSDIVLLYIVLRLNAALFNHDG